MWLSAIPENARDIGPRADSCITPHLYVTKWLSRSLYIHIQANYGLSPKFYARYFRLARLAILISTIRNRLSCIPVQLRKPTTGENMPQTKRIILDSSSSKLNRKKVADVARSIRDQRSTNQASDPENTVYRTAPKLHRH